MLKSIVAGIAGGVLAIAGAGALPVIVGVLGATLGATVLVGLAALRAIMKHRRRPEASAS